MPGILMAEFCGPGYSEECSMIFFFLSIKTFEVSQRVIPSVFVIYYGKLKPQLDNTNLYKSYFEFFPPQTTPLLGHELSWKNLYSVDRNIFNNIIYSPVIHSSQ